MDEAAIQRLNALNRAFYETTAVDFDATRGQAWPGWKALLPHLAASLAVLDVGCGNGRFGVFLRESLAGHIAYTGLEPNAALREAAQAALAPLPNLTCALHPFDLLSDALPAATYDLAGLFGVLHHIPGAATRERVMRDLAACVAPGGLLVVAAWCFYEHERFRERLVAWPDAWPREPHDYLLDWRRGATAIRYCHYVDEAEQARLNAASGLTLIDTYRADGFTGDVNRYCVLRRD